MMLISRLELNPDCCGNAAGENKENGQDGFRLSRHRWSEGEWEQTMTIACMIRIVLRAFLLLLALFNLSILGKAQQPLASLSDSLHLIKAQLSIYGVHFEKYATGTGLSKLERQILTKIESISLDNCTLRFTEATHSRSQFGSQASRFVTVIDNVEIRIADIDSANIETSMVDSLPFGTRGASRILYSVVRLNTIERNATIQVERTIIGVGQYDVQQIKSDSRDFTFDDKHVAAGFAKSFAFASQACKATK